MTEETKLILDDLREIQSTFESELKETRKTLENKIDALQNEVRDIKLTSENVINRNIAIIAECHLDLYRKIEEKLDMTA